MPKTAQSPDGPAFAPAAKPEPLSAILAEMRTIAAAAELGIAENCAPFDQLCSYASRIEAAAKRELSKNRPNNGSKIGQFAPKPDWGVHEALAFANTLANHGWTREANPDAASSCIYALCRHLRAPGNAAALREALEQAKRDHWFDMSPDLRNKIFAALSAPPEPPSNAAKMRDAILAIKSVNDRRPHDAAGYEINDIIEEALALEKGGAE